MSRRGHALLDRGCGHARTAEVWSHSPQYSPRLAAQASRSCSQAGNSLQYTHTLESRPLHTGSVLHFLVPRLAHGLVYGLQTKPGDAVCGRSPEQNPAWGRIAERAIEPEGTAVGVEEDGRESPLHDRGGALSPRTAIRGQGSAIRPDGSNQAAPDPTSSRPGVERLDPAQPGSRVGDLGPSPSPSWCLSEQEPRHGDITVESHC